MPYAAPPSPPPLVWLAQPSPEQVKAAAAFFAEGRTGEGAMTCYVLADGSLTSCRVDDRVTTYDFAAALRHLARAYRLDVKASGAPTSVTISADFPKAYDTPPRPLSEPSASDRATVATRRPDDTVYLMCRVTVAGILADCAVAVEPISADPSSIEEPSKPDAATLTAAVGLAKAYRFAPASLSGRAVDGYLRIPLTSHVITSPDWVSKPNGDDLARYFPAVAISSGIDGKARMQCQVVADGLLKRCLIVSEDPPGVGFGDALLAMSGKFRMKPKSVDGRPVENATVTIPVNFRAPAGVRKPDPHDPDTFKVLPWAAWSQAPSPAMVAEAFPPAARAAGLYGHVGVRCDLTRTGLLANCEDTEESPPGRGFRKAALKLAGRFKTDVSSVKPRDLDRVKVALSFDFSERSLKPAGDRYVRQPQWITKDDGEVATTYPQAARAAGVLSGKGVVDCRIGEDGRLAACLPVSEEPAGVGFGEAAVKTASAMRANLWTLDGEAAAGQKVRLPLRFIYSLDQDPAGPNQAAQDSASGSQSKPNIR